MKTNILQTKKLLAALFAMLMPLLANAHDFEVDGIYYKITSSTDLTVAVTYKGSSYDSYSYEYKGTVTIPTTVTYENKTYSVTSIEERAFYKCSSLTSVTIPESIISIGVSAFMNCTGELIVNCNIPSSSSVYDNPFYGSNFKKATIGDKVTSIGACAFSWCTELTTIVIPESVTEIGDHAFYYCTSLGAITLPEAITAIANSVFSECKSLTSITIPKNVTSIGKNAFYRCSSLTSITIPKNITSIGDGALGFCSGLTSINVEDGNTKYDSRGGCNAIIQTRINNLIAGCSTTIIPEDITSIGNYAFSDRNNLTTIAIPNKVTSIGDYAFYGCSGLTSLVIPESVTSLGDYSFNNCTGELTVNCNIPSRTFLNSAPFAGAEFSKITIGPKVTTIGQGAFWMCRNFTSIVIPESVTTIGGSAFEDCSNLSSVTFAENSQLTSIGQGAFQACSKLSFINIPASVSSIEFDAFNKCRGLTTITIPEKVTSIGARAFSGCSNLTCITLPKNIRSIGSKAFDDCSELLDVYCYAEKVPSTNTDAFNGSYPEYITLHVPDNALESYKTNTPWSSFGTIVSLDAAITRITLSASSATLTAGESLTLTITTTPEDADRNLISWSSNNPSIATVDNTGKVTAIAPGTATITVTANDGSGVSAQCEVTVTPASYVITYLIDGEVFLTDTLISGSAISLPDVLEKEGYTFSGWGEVPETMPAEDVTIEGTFTANKYLVTFKIGDEVIASDSLKYQSAIVAPEAPEKEGYTFNGWGEVADSVPAHDLTYEGSYSVNAYVLTYVVDGEIVKSDSIAYGTAITLLKEPTKEGYTFSGWSEAPATMPAENLSISGKFTINKYLVTFKIGDEVIASNSLEYQSAIVVPEAPEKEGYTFSGWGEVADAVPAHDLTYEGSYSINSYTLTYVVDGEVVLTMPVAYGATIPSLKAPEKEGYTFSGWNEAPATMPAKDVTIEGTFTQLPSVYLTINQADNGCVKQHLVQGTSCTFVIEAAEGWKIHTVTFNGEDVTSQLTEEGTFTTPELQGDAVLNIAYEKTDDAIESTRAGAIKVQGHQGIISITGATEGTDISLYTTDGTLVTRETAEGDTTQLIVPTGQVYIVKVADTVVKIGM